MIAYELRAEYAGTVEQVLTVNEHGDPDTTQTVPLFTGGVIRAGDKDLDVRAELEQGNGRIVIDDADPHAQAAVIALDGYPALKRVAAAGADATLDPLDELNAAQARAEASRIGLSIAAGTKADEVRAGLKAHRDALAAGDDVAPSDSRTVTIQADGTLSVEATTPAEG